MKKSSFFCLSLLLLFSLSACGAPTQADAPLTVHHKATDVKLSLGMTKEAVEDALTSNGLDSVSAQAPTEPCGIWSTEYGKGEDKITVWYSGETEVVTKLMVVQISNGDYHSQWNLDGSISLGSSKDEIQNIYGASSVESDDYLAYHYDTNGNEPNGDAMVGFQLDTTGQTEYFYVSTMP